MKKIFYSCGVAPLEWRRKKKNKRHHLGLTCSQTLLS